MIEWRVVLMGLVVWGLAGCSAGPQETNVTPRATAANVESTATSESAEQQADEPKEVDPATARLMAMQTQLKAIYTSAKPENLLEQIEGYRKLDSELGSQDPDIHEIAASYLSWKLSTVGRYQEAHGMFDQASPSEWASDEPMAAQRKSLEGFAPRDAFTAIQGEARTSRAVFINEGHHVPQHRAFMLRLLPELRAQGFTHFAAETLSHGDTELQERGYPTAKSGVYIDEPLYGDLVRTAIQLGFQVVAYEWQGRDRKEREPGQARNLVERVFDGNPDARVVVHLGYGHNRESAEAYSGRGAMAHHFASLTGIDPLTIDQTELTERSEPAYEHELYSEICGTLDSPQPVVLENQQGELWHQPGSDRDITLCHPRSRFEHGRPIWLAIGGSRQAVPLPNDVCGTNEHCLVVARPSTERPEAISIDRVEVRPGEPAAALMLPAGTFTIDVLAVDGTNLRSMTRTVAAR